jgi:hypothetical protein
MNRDEMLFRATGTLIGFWNITSPVYIYSADVPGGRYIKFPYCARPWVLGII